MRTADFDYSLPPDLIAQTPVEPRDSSRLMVLDRAARSIRHERFHNLPELLRPGDVLVFNDTRVIPARLTAVKDTGGKVEILLLQRQRPGVWQVLARPSRRLPAGTRLHISDRDGRAAECLVIEVQDGGARLVEVCDEAVLVSAGAIPLPPYIHQPLADPERYQTVYSRVEGSAAAPTAGLHFTPELLERLSTSGIECLFVTLHVGLDTFQPVREDDPSHHRIHREFGIIQAGAAAKLARARAEGRRVIAVGTTSSRLLEAASEYSRVSEKGFAGWVDLFIVPGYRFKVLDGLITNFHLPRTTLLMLVSAFAGREFILEAYQEAVRERYRFYSFGDAMLIL